MNNKVHLAIKILPFIVNYKREIRMGADIRRKEKIEKIIKFIERMRKVQKKAEATLRKAQEKMKKQVDRGKREVGKKKEKIILSMKDLVFKERPIKKLMERYVGIYIIKKVVSRNVMKLKLLTFMRIHLIVNVKEWKVEKILNKKKIQRVEKYLVRWKEFMAENNT